MKRFTTTLRVLALLLLTAAAFAYPVPIPQGNIVQNGTFQSLFADWSGNIPGILGNWSSVPNDNAALATDIYQDLPTTPGQQYSISFYAAADVYVEPSVTIEISLSSQPMGYFTTPPYSYNPGLNRYDQMHWQQMTSSFTAWANTTRFELIDLDGTDFGLATVSVTPVPEPQISSILLAAGLVLLATRSLPIHRRRRRANRPDAHRPRCP
ncbi:MAG: hypothetical protein C5B50_02835 [Verrucomicrobia bacterium]|nr:MAG: hypothetical protein C5B50_02835 [Verrucomicrobiota bacterium]